MNAAPSPSLFAIVATQRSGTSFLQSLFDSHPDVCTLGEVFGDKKSRHNYYTFLGAAAAADPEVVRPLQFLANWHAFIEAERDPAASVVGFKIMYNHLEYLSSRHADWLFTEISLIHLVRRNMLRTHVSNLINKQKIKPAHSTVPGELVRIALPPDSLVAALERREAAIERHLQRLPERQTRTIFYEDLVAEPERELASLQRFLKLTPQPLQSKWQRSNPHPVREIVINAGEVAAALAGTRFAWMLEE